MARFDGIKYGYRAKDFEGIEQLYERSRSEGFGAEVKRRILLGSFVLSAGYYDAYYKKALAVRTLIRREMESVLDKCNIILSPVAPTTAYRLGEKRGIRSRCIWGISILCLSISRDCPRSLCPMERIDRGCPLEYSSSEELLARRKFTRRPMRWNRKGRRIEMKKRLRDGHRRGSACGAKTQSKIFCGCSTAFGAEPNTQCCPVCMGMPGALPVLNEKVVEYAVRAGIATGCTIAEFSKQDRKNYFYPDLPKAYQISQYDMPLCERGYLDIDCGQPKRIGITRIHIEEDAGKLVHTAGGETLCDYNRCGVPLIEIVSEPDMRSAEEVNAFLRKLRAILLYTGVSDCKMQEGSMRCDVNLSVRKKGEQKMGTRTEMKNLNSFQFIMKAIAYEFARQVEAVEAGESIAQETRRFDQELGKTFSMRSKEDADDYRYFPDPDLVPIVVSQEEVRRITESIPELPDARKARYIEQFGIAPSEAEILVSEREVADYFEEAASWCSHPSALSSLMLGEVFRLLGSKTRIPILQSIFRNWRSMWARVKLARPPQKSNCRFLGTGGRTEEISGSPRSLATE